MDYQYLRSLGNEPRLHPNGFIQLDIDDRTRLHVWTEKPLTEHISKNRIHDHVFDFRSTVICGSVIDTKYQLRQSPKGRYEVFDVIPYVIDNRAGSPERSCSDRFDLLPRDKRKFVAGEQYALKADEIHETTPCGLTATIISYKVRKSKRVARIFRPDDQRTPKFFDRKTVSSRILWHEIKLVCERIKHSL